MTTSVELDLDEIIRQYVSLGEKDPLNILKRIEKEHGDNLGSLLIPYAEEIIRERAVRALSARRRTCETALSRDDSEVAQQHVKMASVWIPDVGWKRYADCTAEEIEERARYYEEMGSMMLAKASWCREVAMLMRVEGADTLGELDTIPPIPGGDL